MKYLRTFLATVAAIVVSGFVVAQVTGNYWPVPSNVFTAKGALVVSQDINHLTGIAAGTAGQMLTGQGAATAPSWQSVRFASDLTPASVAANVCVEEGFSVPGVAVGDVVVMSPPAGADPYAVSARPSGADTVAVNFCNPAAVVVTPNSGSYGFMAFGAS